MSDIPIADLLNGLGLGGDSAAGARTILENARLTNSRKQRIDRSKLKRARAAIDECWQRLCHNCLRRAAHDGRPVVQVAPAACALCGGSNNNRAVRAMVDVCRRRRIERLVVVGGSPSLRRELAELVDGDLELRLVDGTGNPSRGSAQRNIAWADLIVVLGSSELAHKVSNLYTRDAVARRKLGTTSRRGIEALADAVIRSDVVNEPHG